jgi:hypothetical protein
VRNAAKHESMKKRKSSLAGASVIVSPPAFPTPGNRIFDRIGTALSASRGYPLRNIDLARLIGQSESTTSHWFGIGPQPHVVSCFCLLEQLLPVERYRLVDALCRELPLIDHPRLRHNPAAVTSLRHLLAQNTGLTLIIGGTDEQRTFLLAALGQSFCRNDRLHRTAAGIDLHEPDWFSPVETMLYFRGPAEPPKVREAVRRTWPQVMNTDQPLILLNGIWSALPELRNDVLSLATRRHVIVAEQQIAVPRSTLEKEHPRHTLLISTPRENSNWIAVQTTRAQ